jgi:hypothetical protein
MKAFRRAAYGDQASNAASRRYEAQGFYRPEVDCIMFTRGEQFCAVCRRALARVIDTYVR